MKKLLKIAFAFLMTFSVASCGKNTENISSNSEKTEETSEISEKTSFEQYITVTDYQEVEQVESETIDKKQYLGIMGLAPTEGKTDTIQTFDTQLNSDLYNVFLFGISNNENFLDEQMTKVFEKGKHVWFYIMDTVWIYEGSGYVVREDAYKRLYDLKSKIANKKWYDALLGFHIDEPLLAGMTRNDLVKGTKAINEVFPEKRMWVNFAGFAFNEDLSSSRERMNKETGKYISDLSFDLYGEFGDTILDTWNNMINMFEGENKYYWAVPMCMSYAGVSTEKQAIDHLEAFYSLIKQTKGGCGIFLYTFGTFSWELEQIGNIGFGDLLVSETEFMTWANKKRPWVDYYNRFYDQAGIAINGGYKPWTNMLAKIQEVSDLIETYNLNKAKKLETTITVEDNQVFEYNGGPQYCIPEENYLPFEYQFRVDGDDIYTDEAPSEIGNYEEIIEVKSSSYRQGKKVKIKFSIVESSKTLINPRDINENYTTTKSTISINRSDLFYSFNGVDYMPYERNSEIDVTDLVILSDYGNAIYFKSGDKEPYIYGVWPLHERVFFDFEGSASEQWSHFSKVSNKKHSGSQCAYFEKDKCTDTGYYHMYCDTSNLYDRQQGTTSIENAMFLKMWIYSEEEMNSLKINLSTGAWVSSTTVDDIVVPAKEWTLVTFDLSKIQRPEGFTLAKLIMFSFVPDGRHEFYVDDITVVSF